ncbi:hypothetical protein ACWC0C_43415 [Streptomyces sp. NPDC001709]
MVLGVLGLEPVVETVYAALLRHPQSNLSDLQAVTDLTEQEVRAALDDLADRAFVRPSRTSQASCVPSARRWPSI